MMDELDQIWAQELDGILENTQNIENSDAVDYLKLKTRNDAIRKIGVRWINETLAAIASEHTTKIEIIRNASHRFAFRGATMAGTLLMLRQGVRCLTLEAGWTRTPSDGFMRSGALAAARFSHFGMSQAGAELGLYLTNEMLRWIAYIDDKNAVEFTLDHIREQFEIFADVRKL